MAASENKKVKVDNSKKSELISFHKENKVLLSNTADKKEKIEAK